jgi:hypothetical protein
MKKCQKYFNKKLLNAAISSLNIKALNPEGWEYETHTCPCCGHKTYTRKPGIGRDIEWPKGGKIKFKKPDKL